jgi:hypothetical protein
MAPEGSFVTRSRKFYLGSVARRWAVEVEGAADRVAIFSPYITLEAVDLIFSGKRPPKCDVYTAFRAYYFVSGASSLAALRRLLDMGVHLYQVRKLHAKMLIIPGRFASIGSQNLTGQGQRNREATVAITNQNAVEKIEQLAARWIEQAEAIGLEQLAEMDAAIEPLKARLAEIEQAARRIDRQLRRNEHARVLAELAREYDRREDLDDEDKGEEEDTVEPNPHEESSNGDDQGDQDAEQLFDPTEEIEAADEPAPDDVLQDMEDDDEDGRSEDEETGSMNRPWSAGIPQPRLFPPEQLASFQEVVAGAPKSREVVDANVTLRNSRPSLVGRAGAKLTRWGLGGERVFLQKNYRYMCILEGVCKWGWVRVAKTRISFISHRLTLPSPVLLGLVEYRLGFEAIWEYTEELQGNLKITISRGGGTSPNSLLATLDCWFGLDCLHLFDVKVDQEMPDLFESEAERLRAWLHDNREEFRTIVLPLILTPFKYEENLYGRRADAFFGPLGTSVTLRLGRIEDQEVLVARAQSGLFESIPT